MRNKEVKGVALMAWMLACSACSLPATETVVEPIDPARKLIGTVQGTGAVSPLLDGNVLVEGVVVRNLMGDSDDVGQEMKETLGEGAGSAAPPIGWFIQDEGDGNPATSDGVFVLDQGYDTSINMPADTEYTMRPGDRARAGGRVAPGAGCRPAAQYRASGVAWRRRWQRHRDRGDVGDVGGPCGAGQPDHRTAGLRRQRGYRSHASLKPR